MCPHTHVYKTFYIKLRLTKMCWRASQNIVGLARSDRSGPKWSVGPTILAKSPAPRRVERILVQQLKRHAGYLQAKDGNGSIPGGN